MNEPQMPEMKMDGDNLYREEVFTDQKTGSIRVMTPVTKDGSLDAERATQYFGQTQLMTPGGALPLSFELEVSSLEQAVSEFAAAAQSALEKTMEELKELRRQSASSIVIPGANDGMNPSKIQMP